MNILYIINIAIKGNLESNFMQRIKKAHKWNKYVYTSTSTQTYAICVISNMEYESVQRNKKERYDNNRVWTC